jgi:hypothetical protein
MVQANKKAKLDKRRTHVLKKHKLLSTKERFAVNKQRRLDGKKLNCYSDSDEDNSSSDDDSSTECETSFSLLRSTLQLDLRIKPDVRWKTLSNY